MLKDGRFRRVDWCEAALRFSLMCTAFQFTEREIFTLSLTKTARLAGF